MKKELKKLSLHKEELVNLNAPEMDSIMGGTGAGAVSKKVSKWVTNSSWDCSIAIASAAYEYFFGSDEDGSDENGSDDNGSNDMGDISKYQDPYYGGCLLPEVEVTP